MAPPRQKSMSGGGGGDPGSPGPSWTVRRSPRPSHSLPRPREVSTWGEAMVTDHLFTMSDVMIMMLVIMMMVMLVMMMTMTKVVIMMMMMIMMLLPDRTSRRDFHQAKLCQILTGSLSLKPVCNHFRKFPPPSP